MVFFSLVQNSRTAFRELKKKNINVIGIGDDVQRV